MEKSNNSTMEEKKKKFRTSYGLATDARYNIFIVCDYYTLVSNFNIGVKEKNKKPNIAD